MPAGSYEGNTLRFHIDRAAVGDMRVEIPNECEHLPGSFLVKTDSGKWVVCDTATLLDTVPASAKVMYTGDLVQTKAEHLLRVTLESNVKHTVQIIDNFGKQPVSIGSALEMIIAKDNPDWGTLVVPAGEHEGTPLVNMIGKAMAAWGEGQPARTNKKNDTQASTDSRGRGDRDGQGSGTNERPSRSSSDSDDSSDTNSDKPPRRGNSSSSGAEANGPSSEAKGSSSSGFTSDMSRPSSRGANDQGGRGNGKGGKGGEAKGGKGGKGGKGFAASVGRGRGAYQQQPDGAAVDPDTIEFHKSDGSTFAFLSLFHQGEGFTSEEGTTYDSVGKMLFHVKMVVLQRPDIAAQILKVTGEGYARRIRSPISVVAQQHKVSSSNRV